MPRFMLFLFILTSCLIASDSDVSLTVTGILPKSEIPQPNSIFFSSNIELNPLEKKTMAIFPKPLFVFTLNDSSEITKTIELYYKKTYSLKTDERAFEFRTVVFLNEYAENDLNPLLKKKFNFTDFRSKQVPNEMVSSNIFDSDSYLYEYTVPKTKKLRFSYPYLKTTEKKGEDFAFEKREAALTFKRDYEYAKSFMLGMDRKLNFLFEFTGDSLSVRKDFDNFVDIGLKLSDCVLEYGIGQDLLMASMEVNDYCFDVFMANGNFRALFKSDELFSDDISAGIAVFNAIPVPIANWRRLDGGLFSIGADVFSDDSYGAVFDFFSHPYSVSINAGMNMYKNSLNITGSFSASVEPLNTFFEIRGGYDDSYFVDLAFNNHSISFNEFNMDINGNIGYNGGLYFGLGTVVETGNFVVELNANYVSGGINFDVAAGIKF